MINIKTSRLISSWFFIGFAPYMPGTFGSVSALPLCFIMSIMNNTLALIVLILFTLLAICVSNLTEKLKKKKDPSEIVIDEVVGMIFTLFAIPFTFYNVIWGILLFRIIDILKPQPIKFIERKTPGGLGVVLDDVIAGMISNFIIRFTTIYFCS